MSHTHTPGPWIIDDGDIGIVRGPGGMIADVSGSDSGYFRSNRPQRERHANARLIAAAPDLLAACKAAIHKLIDCCDMADMSGDDRRMVIEQLRAAVEKAKGGER